MLIIRHAPPVKGKRERICRTDEATVSRIHAPGTPYDCMVERLQKIDGEREKRQFFQFSAEGTPWLFSEVESSRAQYHILKFLALGLAGRMFPDNFVRARELRLSKSKRCAATYSGFVKDDDGAIGRQGKARRRYYAAQTDKEKDESRERTDREERARNPQMVKLIEEVRDGGILLAHPEANYHLCDGKIVFFEVQGIELTTLLRTGRERFIQCDDAGILELTAAAYAVLMEHWFFNMSNHAANQHLADWFCEYIWHFTSHELREEILRIFMGDPRHIRFLLESGSDIFKSPLKTWIGGGFSGALKKSSLCIDPNLTDFPELQTFIASSTIFSA